MKVRCSVCGKVVKLISLDKIDQQRCSECGSGIVKPAQETRRTDSEEIVDSQTKINQPQGCKGQLQGRRKIVTLMGLVVVLVIMSIFSEGTSTLWEKSTPLALVCGGAGVIAIIVTGAWFEKKSRR